MTTAYDRLDAQDTLTNGDCAVARQDSIGGFLVGTRDDLFDVFNSQEVPCGRQFKAIGEGEDQHTEALA